MRGCARCASLLAVLPLAWSLSISSANEASTPSRHASVRPPDAVVPPAPKLQLVEAEAAQLELRVAAPAGGGPAAGAAVPQPAPAAPSPASALLEAVAALRAASPARTLLFVMLVLVPLVFVLLFAWAMTGSSEAGSKLPEPGGAEEPRQLPRVPRSGSTGMSRQTSAGSSMLSMFYQPPPGYQEPSETAPDAPQVNMFLGVSDYQVLCPELVVQRSEGLTMQMRGNIETYQQEDMLDLCMVDHAEEEMLHCYISELKGASGGVLVETSLQQPVAFLHTEAAVGPNRPRRNRHVSVVRAGSGNVFSMDGRGTRDPPFAVVYRDPPDDGVSFIMRHCTRSGEPGPVIFQIHQSANRFFNIVDAGGALTATCEERESGSWWRGSRTARRVLKFGPGADTAMIVCAVVAVHKLA